LSESECLEYLAQGADSARLHPIPPALDISSSDNVPRSSQPSVVYLGRLHPIKRVDVLLDAFARVRTELPDATLDVIGAPTAYGDQMRARAGEGVFFRGLIPEQEKSRALAASHVFALLSASEGLPIAPLEALACGTPVVLSPGCGLPQVDGVAGIVCDGSAAGAAEALLTLLRDPARVDALGAAGQTFASAYRRENVVPELVELLERVATSSSNSA
jgi:glycosyltransferase involved in cell wall biosynthesis